MYQWEIGREGKQNKKSAHNSGSLTFHGSETFPTAFDSVPQGMLRPTTIETLKTKMGFSSLLPTQARCYSHIFKGTDTVLHSRTGTGKTLAFLLPLIERHVSEVDRQREERTGPWMVIALPTVELAAQIQRVITEVYYPSGKKQQQQQSKKKKNTSSDDAAEDDEQEPGISSSTSLYGVRTLVAGLDAITEADVMTRCDILVGTVYAIDRLLRYKVDGQGNRIEKVSSKNGNDESSSDEEEDSDDEEEEGLTNEPEQGDNNNRRRPRSASASTNKTKPENSAAAKNKNNNNTNKPNLNRKKNKVRFVISPAARYIRTFVIDEVDHTLGPKFSTSARRVHNLLKTLNKGSTIFPSGRGGMQFVLVGATIPDWISRVGFLGDPNRRVTYRLVSAGASKLPASLKCFSVECSRDQDERVSMTCRLLKQLAPKRVVVFAPTKLVELIAASKFGKSNNSNSNINIRRLDSTANEVERLRVIEEFNQGVANVLICTDRASRGLDFTNIDTVISTSFPPPSPTAAETFVHRAGRAGRAGKDGDCITLMDSAHDGEMQSKKMIESSVHVLFRPLAVTVAADQVEIAKHSGRFSHNEENKNQNNNNNNSGNKAKKQQTQQQDKNSDAEITCQLKVKNPFKLAKQQQQQNPNRKTPKQIVENTLDGELLKKIKFVSNNENDDDSSVDASEIVRFKVSQLLIADIRSALWKYDVTVVA